METVKSHKTAVIWNSYFTRIFVYAILCQLTMSISNTALPLYIINSLGYTNAQSGLLGTVFTIASMVCRFAAGGLSDRYGRRRMMVIGALMVGLALIFMGFSTGFMVILVFKAFQGVGHALNSTSSNAAASDVLPTEKLGEGIGYYGLHSALTTALGPTIALALMGVAVATGETYNYQFPLLIGGVAGLIAMIIAATLGYERKYEKIPHNSRGFHISDYIERRSLVPALLQMFQTVAAGASVFMIVFANSMGFTSIRYYYIIAAAVTLLIRFLLGKKLGNMKPVIVAIIPLILLIISYTALASTMTEAAFLAVGVISGIFNAMLAPTFSALSLKLAPPGRRGAASATYWLGFDVGMAVGQIAFGAIIDIGGFSASFYSAAAYLGVFAVVAILVLRKLPSINSIESPAD